MFDSFDEELASKTSNFNKKNSNVRKNTKKFGFKEGKQNFDIEDDDNDINEKLENSLTSLNGCLFNRTDLKGFDFRNEKVSINQKERISLFKFSVDSYLLDNMLRSRHSNLDRTIDESRKPLLASFVDGLAND